jgi:hypothetical protein
MVHMVHRRSKMGDIVPDQVITSVNGTAHGSHKSGGDNNINGTVVGQPVQSVEQTDRDYIRQIVTDEVFGAPFTGSKQFFYMIDPYKQEQFIRAPKLFDDINIYFAVIYYAGLALYTVYAILQFYATPPVTTNTMAAQSTLQPVYLNISITCSAQYACGNWTLVNGNYVEPVPITFTQTWSHGANIASACTQNNGLITAYPSDIGYILLPVCYSSSIFDGIFINMPFTSTYTSSTPYASVLLTGNTEFYTNDMYNMVTMAAPQSKIAFFSQTVTTTVTGVSTSAPYVGDLFYNGS